MNNGKIYCASGLPFGGDDTGNAAGNSLIWNCENRIAKSVAKLMGSIIKCHCGRAIGKLADDSAEDACESPAITKFLAAKTTGCDACTTSQSISGCGGPCGTGLQGLANFVEYTFDQSAGRVYCQSPSGAFLDASEFLRAGTILAVVSGVRPAR
jgi:hypothetical protein